MSDKNTEPPLVAVRVWVNVERDYGDCDFESDNSEMVARFTGPDAENAANCLMEALIQNHAHLSE